jgi:hypothetical protein
MSFEDYVYVGPLDDLHLKVDQEYLTPTKTFCYMTKKEIDAYRHDTKPLDKSYFDMLKPEQFVISSIGKNNTDIIDTNIRQSKIYKDCKLKICSKSYWSYSKYIDTQKIKPLKNSLECEISYNINLLKYDEGDHFNEYHYDTFRNGNIATFLIFPPHSISGEYTGGDLVFKINNCEYRVEPSKFDDKTMCVIFGKVLHKCEPVTSGTRYVIKSSIKAKLPEILSEQKKIKLSDLNEFDAKTSEVYIQQKINENEIKLNEYKSKLKNTIKEYYEIKMLEIFNDIDNKYYPQKINSDPDNYISNKEADDKNFEYMELKNRIQNLEKTLNVLETQMIDLSSKSSDSKQIINYFTLKEDKYNFCVMPYYIEDISDMKQYPKSMREYIRQLIENGWNITYFYDTFSLKTDYEEGYQKLQHSTLFDYDFSDDCHYQNQKYHFNTKLSDITDGKQVSSHSEYNDKSGDDLYEEYECVCFLIWK